MKVSICLKKLHKLIAAASLAFVFFVVSDALPVNAAVKGVYVGNNFYDYTKTDTFADNTKGTNFSGTLSGAAISQVTFLRANGSSGTTSGGNDFKFNGLSIYVPTRLPVALAPTNSGWNINFAAIPCLTYRVQRATNITGPWTDIGKVTALFNNCEFNNTSSPTSQTFYRTVTP